MAAGTVTDFDAARGLGAITDSAGGVWPFHCVELADGSRDVAVGTPVTFEVLRKLGRFEAAEIRPRES